jgi:hypothetical protein
VVAHAHPLFFLDGELFVGPGEEVQEDERLVAESVEETPERLRPDMYAVDC